MENLTESRQVETVSEIAVRIVGSLSEHNRYDEALLPQIVSLAGSLRTLYIANRDIDELETVVVVEESRYGEKRVPHPAFKVQRDAQEQVTKQMKALGLTTEDLGAGVSTDPLVALTKEMLEVQGGKAPKKKAKK